MVSQVQLGQSSCNNIGTIYPNNALAPLSMPNSIWSNGTGLNPFSTNSYANDFMMSNIDFDAMSTGTSANPQQAGNQQVGTTQTATTSTPAQQNTFTGQQNSPNSGENLNELNNYLVNTKPQKKSNIGKITGSILGFAAPIADKALSVLKGSSAKTAFNLKQLGVTCPIIAGVGLGLGYLVDGFINTYKTKKQEETLAKNQNKTIPPQPQLQS